MTERDALAGVHELPTDQVVSRYVPAAKTIIARRKARGALLRQGMLADAAWDVLLHLFVHRAEPAQTEAPAIAKALELSETIVLRWLGLLRADGLALYRPRAPHASWELSGSFLVRLVAYLREHYGEEG